ncbi:morphogenic membrane protein MmpA [Streptomyces sp. HK10]|uniref:morphogenic membrane protein MmpA n=1 Tax=Streptomyces sp. HK10 TaxID=3373255 RepID=UPI00374874F7
MERIMENVHGTPEMSPSLAPDLGRGPVLALALAGTLAVGWVIAMLCVIASWVTG